MSGRKRLKQLVIDQMFAGKISVPEAQARMTWIKTGVYKSAEQDAALAEVDRRLAQAERLIAKGKKRAFQAGRLMDLEVTKARKGLAGSVTGWEQYYDSTDPSTREGARAAAEQAMVAKGLMPGPAPGRQSRTARFVPGTGPDGRFRWEQPQAPGSPGLQFAPHGTAGR